MLGETKLFPYDLGHEPPLEPPVTRMPRCPVCGGETWNLLRDREGSVFGCPDCVEVLNAVDGTEDALIYFWNGGV